MNLVLLFIFVVQVGLSVILGTFFNGILSDYVQIFLTQIIPVFIPALIYCFASEAGFKGYERSSKITFLNIILCILATICVNILISYLTTYIGTPLFTFLSKNTQTQYISLPKTSFEFVVDIIFICLMPAIFEEMLFRGVVLTNYEKIYGSKKAIVMCGFVFALMHNSISSFIPQFLVGIFLSYIVFKFNSLYMGMIAHFTNNFVTLIIQMAVSNNWNVLKTVLLSKVWLTAILLIIILLFAFVMIMHLNRHIKFKKREYQWKQVKKEKKIFNLIVLLFIIMQLVFYFLKFV